LKIAQVIDSGSWGEITPDAFERGIGGREGAMLRLSNEWARAGHEVTNFVPVQLPQRYNGGSGMHEYVPLTLAPEMLKNFSYDAVVSWEMPEVFQDEVAEMQPVRVVEMQVAHINPYMEQFLPNASAIAVLSRWHGDFVLADALSATPEQIHVLPNGVDLMHYAWDRDHESRRTAAKRFFYSSSPDRGLWHLLRMWPEIRGRYPEAQLHVAYGVERWTSGAKWQHLRVGEMATEIELLLRQPGVVDVGTIGQERLAQIQRRSAAWLYPCDTIQPTETGCITAIEAGAAGAPMIITDCDCLGSEFGDVASVTPLPFEPAEYVEALFDVLESPTRYAGLRLRGRQLAEERQWQKIAPRWLEMFESLRPA
jgi:glycosyltransferase involved in cell wall biosynthesis